MSEYKWHPDFDPRLHGVNQVVDEAGYTVCFVATGFDEDEQVEVTNLLAASPDLLASCIEVCDWITDQFEEPNEIIVVQHLKAAISKARAR